MKILVIGANGMAGHMIRDYLARDPAHEIWSTTRSGNGVGLRRLHLDARDERSVITALHTARPNLVINAAGLLNQDAERHPLSAQTINADFPRFLSAKGIEMGYRLIHISTDCVFSGKRGDYSETDPRDATGVYGETKKRGEEIDPRHLVIRTSIIGPELKDGIGLFHWFMGQREAVRGYTQVWWNGVTTLELAKSIPWTWKRKVSGLVHLCAEHKISKCDVLSMTARVFGGERADIIPDDTVRSDKSLVNTRADYPYTPPAYSDMLTELKEWMERAPVSRYAQYRIKKTVGRFGPPSR